MMELFFLKEKFGYFKEKINARKNSRGVVGYLTRPCYRKIANNSILARI
jgi:hypothetical protein